MDKQLLEIEPSELKFVFELKKQSSCSVQLTNNTNHHVAFKVKTTSPNKYSVRPNVGVLMPKSACEFIVTMQAQRAAPTDMVCKDKFLILSTIVPVGTTNEDITSSLFVKDDSRYVEESKMKVALITPAHSPALSPINGDLKNELANKKDPNVCTDEMQAPKCTVLNSVDHKIVNEELKHEKGSELKSGQDVGLNTMKDVAELKQENDVLLKTVKDAEELKPKKEAEIKVSTELKSEQDVGLNTMKDVEELKPKNDVLLKTVKDTEELKPENDVLLKTVKDAEELQPKKEAELKMSTGVQEFKLIEDIEEMKLKLNELESKLNEAELTISKLTEERQQSNLETKILQEKLADLGKRSTRIVQVGFPLLYVLTVALVCVFLGYRLHP